MPTNDQGLSRADVNPTLRIPFTRWPFLTVNSTVSWRGTYWTESCVTQTPGRRYALHRREPGADPGSHRPEFFDFQTRITGPVFNRIWNTPGNGYAEKFKHVIEPTLAIQHATAIDKFDQIVRLDGTDFIVGNMTRFTYGVANRLYAKKETSREILSATISQSYYTDERGPQYDPGESERIRRAAQTNFAPCG